MSTMAITTLPVVQAPVPPARLTVEEFERRYGGTNAELIDGVVKEPAMAGARHGKICVTFSRLIGNWVEDHDLGHVMSNDTWIRVGTDKVRGGDVLYISYERLPRDQPVLDGAHVVAPDLVGEVKSPSDRWSELFIKIGEYLDAGVRVVVVIDPDTSTVSVYRDQGRQLILIEGDTLTLPDVLPGLSVPVARLFA